MFNVVLDACQSLGKKLPRFDNLASIVGILKEPAVVKFVAVMYSDLLEFYKRVVGLLTFPRMSYTGPAPETQSDQEFMLTVKQTPRLEKPI